ncbi:hypothetical protein [Streptomyces sp. JH002]|uniref:hypothetical protein n=1 Tax=Streptomyces sp. JH002 TaxID=2763259 RepID=UPI003D809979
MAILPELSLTAAPPTLRTTDLGAERSIRRIGCVTIREQAGAAAVRALIRELRGSAGAPAVV